MNTGIGVSKSEKYNSQRDLNKPEDGSLLRLFQSDMFDAYYHMFYLYHREEAGVQDYLVNLLYKRTDEDIYFYLPQLCCLCLARYKTSTLYRFVLEKASKSMHLALKTAWLFQAASDELWHGSLGISTQLNQEVEMAIVNSKPAPFGVAFYGSESEVEIPDLFLRQRLLYTLQNRSNNLPQEKPAQDDKNEAEDYEKEAEDYENEAEYDKNEAVEPNEDTEKEQDATRNSIIKESLSFYDDDAEETSDETVPYVAKVTNENDGTLSSKHAVNRRITIQLRYPSVPPEFSKHTGPISLANCRIKLPSVYDKLGSPFIYSSFRVDDPSLINSDMQRFIIKQRRCDYYNLLNSSISSMIDVSNRLAQVPEENSRILLLQKFFESLNEWMFCRRCIVAASEGTFAMTGLTIPLSEFGSLNTTGTASHSTQVIRFITEECKVLSSKKRAPYVLVFEVADLDEDVYDFIAKPPVNLRASSKRQSKMLQIPYVEDLSISTMVTGQVTWKDLYVYECLQEELKMRHLLKFPSAGVASETPESKPPLSLLSIIRYSMGIQEEFFENKSYQVSSNAYPTCVETTNTKYSSEENAVKDEGPIVTTKEPPQEKRNNNESSILSSSGCVEGAENPKDHNIASKHEDIVFSLAQEEAKTKNNDKLLIREDNERLSQSTPENNSVKHSLGLVQETKRDSDSISGECAVVLNSVLAQKQKDEGLRSNEAKTQEMRGSQFLKLPDNAKKNNKIQAKLSEAQKRQSLHGESTLSTARKSSDESSYIGGVSKHDNVEDIKNCKRRERSKSTGEYAELSESNYNQGANSAHTRKSVWKRAAYAKRLRFKLWGRLWNEKKEKYRKLSPYGQLKSWNLGCVLVKGGDDLRLELLASQLVRQFQWIFENAKLPLYLRPYEVLVTGVSSGIMVFVPDTVSVHTLKKRFKNDSIAQVFEAAFADNPYQAKKNFIESHAAYSVIGYLLQVKDRHNANFLLDAEGHIIHIDYGFMLSNSPGYVNFEGSPFKLTQEFIDIMDGEVSDNYEYFRTLVIRGFLAARKHRERLLLLVKMMLPATKMSCFSGDPQSTFAAMEERFMPNLTEEICIQRVADLIDVSVNNWRTIQYDAYQRYTNKIL